MLGVAGMECVGLYTVIVTCETCCVVGVKHDCLVVAC